MTDDLSDAEDGGGFDVNDWGRLAAFTGRIATLEDVEAGRAVFALADTQNPHPIDMDLPQPVIWWDDDGEQAAVAVQAESHGGVSGDGEAEADGEDEDGGVMQVVGLVLADGSTAVALLDDVDLVDDTDPTWRALVTAAIGDEDAAG